MTTKTTSSTPGWLGALKRDALRRGEAGPGSILAPSTADTGLGHAQRQREIPWQALGVAIMALGVGGGVAWAVTSISNLYLLMGLVVGVGVVVAILQHIEWGLLTLVFVTYAYLSTVIARDHGGPSIAQPFMVMILGAIGVRWMLFGEKPSGPWLRPVLLMIAFGAISALAFLFAESTSEVVRAIDDYAKNVMVAVAVIWLLKRASTLRLVVWALLAAGMLMGTISVYQQFTGTFDNSYWGFSHAAASVSQIDGYRLGGPLASPVYYAQILVVLVPLALDRVWNEKRLALRALAGWTLAVCVISLFFTYSRGGFLALIIVLAMMFAAHPPKPPTILLTVVVVVLTLQFVPERYSARLATLVNFLPGAETDFRNEMSFRGRAGEMSAAWVMFRDHPILGVGAGNFNVNYLKYSPQIGLDWRREDRSAHSLYLEMAAERGVAGLGLFTLILGFAFKGLLEGRRDLIRAGLPGAAGLVYALMVGLIGNLVTAFFLHDAYPRYLWLLLGIAFAVPLLAKRELDLVRPQ